MNFDCDSVPFCAFCLKMFSVCQFMLTVAN